MSDASSAGSHGKTCRQDVLGRVDIPVVPGAAGRARPMRDRKHEFCKLVPARRASLTRWIPAVDDDELPSVPLALVVQLATELGPAAVRDGAGQPSVADQAGYVQVLDHDRVGGAYKPGADPVQEIAPRIADLAVGAGHLKFRLFPVRGTLGDTFALGGVAGVPCCQGAVPHDADAAECAAEHCLLLFIRISTAPVRCSHVGSIAHFFVKTAEARRTRLRPLCRLASQGTGFLPSKARASSGGHG
jgi:hypothetical protein